jgi:hypothetical protein
MGRLPSRAPATLEEAPVAGYEIRGDFFTGAFHSGSYSPLFGEQEHLVPPLGPKTRNLQTFDWFHRITNRTGAQLEGSADSFTPAVRGGQGCHGASHQNGLAEYHP